MSESGSGMNNNNMPPPQQQPPPAAGLEGMAPDSVLPHLVKVYNDMAQSKTPEGDGPRPGPLTAASFSSAAAAFAPPPAASTGHHHHHSSLEPAVLAAAGPTAAEWNAYAGGTSLPSIPPVPPYGSGTAAVASLPPTLSTAGHAEGGTYAETPTSHTNSNTTRSLRRKRSAQTASFKEDASESPSPPTTSGGGGGGSSSTASRGNKNRRKGKETDARWSKRFSWPEELHRDFVAAIFDVGLKHSSPSTLLEHMPKHEQITTERIKSHLQKYRLHRVKSKKEFMASYDSGLKKMHHQASPDAGTASGIAHGGALSAGEVASMLTHHTVQGTEPATAADVPLEAPPARAAPPHHPPQPVTVESEEPVVHPDSTGGAAGGLEFLTLPQLSEVEKQSPIGASMGYLMGLFFSLKQQLMAQRAAARAEESKRQATTAAAAVYDSFVLAGGTTATVAASSATEAPASTVVSNPSTRNNLEENNMMKREMQNQMAFQNKMRGLKQQELNKFISHSGGAEDKDSDMAVLEGATPVGVGVGGMDHQQGAGEMAGPRRIASASIGNAEEFWNTDVMDDQLFEFLMSET